MDTLTHANFEMKTFFPDGCILPHQREGGCGGVNASLLSIVFEAPDTSSTATKYQVPLMELADVATSPRVIQPTLPHAFRCQVAPCVGSSCRMSRPQHIRTKLEKLK